VLHWLHSLLPHIPRYGYVLVFIIVLLNNVGLPLPGEAILLGAGFIVGKTAGSLWQSVAAGSAASFLGGICAFWIGRRLGHAGLEKIRWLHLTRKTLKWPQKYLELHGAKTVFLARFVAILPPMAANLLAGMTKMRWRTFLLYDLAGSVAFASSYILIGYVVGKQWQLLETWFGPTALYLVVAGIILIVPAILFRSSLSALLSRCFPGKKWPWRQRP
jgi:membrane protein DedA with SNARE-associated domain